MFADLVRAYNDYERLQLEAASISRGRAVLAYGNPPHVLYAAVLIEKCWLELAPQSIANC